MIRPEASPLAVPVRIAVPPPRLGFPALPGDVLEELHAWLRSHGIDPDVVTLDTRHGILVDRACLTVRPVVPPRSQDWQVPLISHPSLRMLTELAMAGGLICTATHRIVAAQWDRPALTSEEEAALLGCAVQVDSRGRHPGPHAALRHNSDQESWPNDDEATTEFTPPWLPNLLAPEYLADAEPGIVTTAPQRLAGPAYQLTRVDVEAALRQLTDCPPARARYVVIPHGELQAGGLADVYEWDPTAGAYRKLEGPNRIVEA